MDAIAAVSQESLPGLGFGVVTNPVVLSNQLLAIVDRDYVVTTELVLRASSPIRSGYGP